MPRRKASAKTETSGRNRKRARNRNATVISVTRSQSGSRRARGRTTGSVTVRWSLETAEAMRRRVRSFNAEAQRRGGRGGLVGRRGSGGLVSSAPFLQEVDAEEQGEGDGEHDRGDGGRSGGVVLFELGDDEQRG